MEVNHERAVNLITGSAEQGYIPAIEKLVSMYNSGEGVNRDYHKAVEWQKSLVEERKKKYDNGRGTGIPAPVVAVFSKIFRNTE